MAVYEVPEAPESRLQELLNFMDEFKAEYGEFKEKGKKAAGSRARKTLNNIRKLGGFIRKDIQAELVSMRKPRAPKPDAPAETATDEG